MSHKKEPTESVMDEASGKMINPHNPEYITKRPWYLGDSGPSLNHHNLQKEKHLLSIQESDGIAQARRTSVAPSAASGAKIAPGVWVEALRRGKKPWLPAKVLKTRLDDTYDVEFENGTKESRVARASLKLTVAQMGSRVGLESHGIVGWDAKRDRWHGYDAARHSETVERYEKLDEERKRQRKIERARRAEEQAAKRAAREVRRAAKAAAAEKAAAEGGAAGAAAAAAAAAESSSSSDSDDSDDSDSDGGGKDGDVDDEFVGKDTDANFESRTARQGGVGGAQMKMTVRNLRVREDTAKYLRNLDPNSAYYDAKTHSMRENPTPNVPEEDLEFAGDNFVRADGDSRRLAATQHFCWSGDAAAASTALDLVADPSAAEMKHREHAAETIVVESGHRERVMAEYGGEEHMAAPDSRLTMASRDGYVEYGLDGRVLKGEQRKVVKSRYPEDVRENGHTSVFGSWFDRRAFAFGFACCHSTVQNSYCTGRAGLEESESAARDGAAAAEALAAALAQASAAAAAAAALVDPFAPAADGAAAAAAEAAAPAPFVPASAKYGEQLKPELDDDKMAAARSRAAKRDRGARDGGAAGGGGGDRRRKYSKMEAEPTAEDLEVYRESKVRSDDPMLNFKDVEDEE